VNTIIVPENSVKQQHYLNNRPHVNTINVIQNNI